MAYDNKELEEAKKWLEKHKNEIEPEIKDEIDGKEVVSIYDLINTKDEPTYEM